MSFFYNNLLAMPFCENCGNKVPDTSKICSCCRRKIENVFQGEEAGLPTLIESQSVSEKNYRKVKSKGKYGFKSKGNWIIQPEFEALSTFDQKGYSRAKINGKVGYINKLGIWIIQPDFETLGYFDEKDECQAKINGKCGIINRQGNWIIQPDFDELSKFDEEYYCKAKINGKYGFINRMGVWIIHPIYDDIFHFYENGIFYYFNRNGIAEAWLDSKDGFINRQGYWMSQPIINDPTYIFESYFGNNLDKNVYLKENIPNIKLEAFCENFNQDFISKCSFFVYYDDTFSGKGNYGFAIVKNEDGNWLLLFNSSSGVYFAMTFLEGSIKIPLQSDTEDAMYDPEKKFLKGSSFRYIIKKDGFSKTSKIFRKSLINRCLLFLKYNGDGDLEQTKLTFSLESSIKPKDELIFEKSSLNNPKDSAGIR